MSEINSQPTEKKFVISIVTNKTAEEIKADINGFLSPQDRPETKPVTVDKVKRVLDAGYISIDERNEVIELLKEYAKTSLKYQDFLHLFFTFITDHDQVDVNNGLWDFYDFVKSLVHFFLQPANAAAYIEDGGGRKQLSEYLPLLLQTIGDMAHSKHTQALLEAVHYESNYCTIKREDYEETIEKYGLTPKLNVKEQQQHQEAA